MPSKTICMMKAFNPTEDIDNSRLILDSGEWPNFHDAEVQTLKIWRGDIRPADNVWIGPIIEASFELCALKHPFVAVLKFHDCDAIRMEEFNHQNALYDLTFSYKPRGTNNDGKPLPPSISVIFEQSFGVFLSFTCFKVEVLEKK
jgi:hypothetical protein